MMASERIALQPERVARHRGMTAGTVCTVVAVLFLAFDMLLKVLRLGPAVEGTASLGYPADSVFWKCSSSTGVTSLPRTPRSATRARPSASRRSCRAASSSSGSGTGRASTAPDPPPSARCARQTAAASAADSTRHGTGWPLQRR